MFLGSLPRLRLLLSRASCPDHRHRKGRKAASSRPQLEAFEDRTLPSIITWINPAGGDWDTAATWRDDQGVNRLPSFADDAVIDFAGITVTHFSGSPSDSVHSLTSAATLAIASGGLSFAAPSEVQALTLSGGTLTGSGDLTVDGALTWTGGTMSGTGHTILNGPTTIGGSPTVAREVDNTDLATVSDGANPFFPNTGVWNNSVGATLVLRGNASLAGITGQPGQLSNAGLVVKSGADDSTATLSIPFTNTGTVNVRTGTLRLTQSLTNDGEFDLGEGALATLAGGSSSGAFSLAADSRVNVTGNFTEQAGGTIDLEANSIWNIGSPFFNSSVFTLQAGASVSGPGTIQITDFSGTLNVNADMTLENVVVNPLGSFGIINVNSGSARITNLTVNNGQVTVAAAGSLEVQNLTQTGGDLNGPGTVTVVDTLTWTGGFMDGAGPTILDGTTTIGGRPSASREIDNAGRATVSDGASFLFGVWNNENGATLTFRGSASVTGIRLNNTGLVLRTGTGNSTSTISTLLDNTGIVDVVTGTLSFQAFSSFVQTLTNEGEFDLEPGAIASLAGQSNSSGTFNLAADSRLDLIGNFEQQSSSIVNLAAGSLVSVGAGFFNGSSTLRAGAAVNGPGIVQVGAVFGSGFLTVTGGASIDNLSVIKGSVTVAVNSSLDVQNLTQTGGTLTGPGPVTIEGALRWTGGTMSGTGHTVVNGTAAVGSGTLPTVLDTRTLDNAGMATVLDLANLRFSNGALWNNSDVATLVLQGSATLSNFVGQPGRLNNAGLLQTTGGHQTTINFAVTNSGTIDLQGVLVINGNYTQTTDGTLNIHIGGTAVGSQYDQLQVHGLATLDGTLNVTLINGFTPVAGNSFRILTFSSRSGDFATKNLPDLGSDLFVDPVYDASGLTLFTRSR